MNLKNRVKLLVQLSEYFKENNEEWQDIKARAAIHNGWFIPDFIELALQQIQSRFLQQDLLDKWTAHYHLDDNIGGKTIGLVMAGNIPLVGFHDFLCAFISGHKQTIKLSSKDDVLLKHIVQKLNEWDPETGTHIAFSEMLKGCDAYIATGTNNSAKYFEQYFSKYPNIIRRNRTSVAVLSGNETETELLKLSDDVHQYFGLGCRNVTKIYVPKGYDFVPLLKAFDRYKYFIDHNKFKNNYDYQLSMALMNNVYYMTNGTTLLIENESVFSPISQLNYSYYSDAELLSKTLRNDPNLQCVVGLNGLEFGQVQCPGLTDYADGEDTMQFLLGL